MTKLSDLMNSCLAIVALMRNHPDITKNVDAQVRLNGIDDKLKSLGNFVAPVPKARVVVLSSEPGDRGTFAVEAMADAMGLKIVEAEIPAAETAAPIKNYGVVPVIKPTAPRVEEVGEPLVIGPTSELIVPAPEQTIPTETHEGTHILIEGKWYPKAKGFVYSKIEPGVKISKLTGLPKRKYERTGEFSADKIEERKKNPRRRLRRS